MNFRIVATIAAFLILAGNTPSALAQKTAGSNVNSPQRARDTAAANKLAKDPRFTALLNSGHADAAKKMLVANGASPNLIVGIQRPKFAWSSGGPSSDVIPNYTCSQWAQVWYYIDGHWCLGWGCLGVFTQLDNASQ
jgi:hypothetical protein